MKSKPANTRYKQKARLASKSNLRWWMIGGVVIFTLAAIILWQRKEIKQTSTNSTSSSSAAFNDPAQNLLVGRWTRTDSDDAYVIEIKSVAADGKLDAGYFNPNPIKVGHAEWQKINNGLMVIVELRDVNYPGSTYTLNFIPSKNRMTGNYYQAVEGTNYEVEFIRIR